MAILAGWDHVGMHRFYCKQRDQKAVPALPIERTYVRPVRQENAVAGRRRHPRVYCTHRRPIHVRRDVCFSSLLPGVSGKAFSTPDLNDGDCCSDYIFLFL